MKHRVSELEGALLDEAVAKAEGWAPVDADKARRKGLTTMCRDGVYSVLGTLDFSRDWALGGPIVEREKIAVVPMGIKWCAFIADDIAFGESYIDVSDLEAAGEGPTLLIAGMRAYVATKFGDEVELPDATSPPSSPPPSQASAG